MNINDWDWYMVVGEDGDAIEAGLGKISLYSRKNKAEVKASEYLCRDIKASVVKITGLIVDKHAG